MDGALAVKVAARCFVQAFKSGALSAVGHDVELEVTELDVDVDLAARTVHAEMDASSLRLVTSVSARDKRTIEDHAANDVLDARRWPRIVFDARDVTVEGDRADVKGTLELHGRSAPLALRATRDAGGDTWRAAVEIDQTAWGIKPFTALLGALKVKPAVLVRVEVSGVR